MIVERLIEVTLVNVGDVDNGGDGGDDGDGDDDDLNEDDGECIGGARVMCNWNGARNLQNSILLYNTFKSLSKHHLLLLLHIASMILLYNNLKLLSKHHLCQFIHIATMNFLLKILKLLSLIVLQ